jgi:hypothetical protein
MKTLINLEDLTPALPHSTNACHAMLYFCQNPNATGKMIAALSNAVLQIAMAANRLGTFRSLVLLEKKSRAARTPPGCDLPNRCYDCLLEQFEH